VCKCIKQKTEILDLPYELREQHELDRVPVGDLDRDGNEDYLVTYNRDMFTQPELRDQCVRIHEKTCQDHKRSMLFRVVELGNHANPDHVRYAKDVTQWTRATDNKHFHVGQRLTYRDMQCRVGKFSLTQAYDKMGKPIADAVEIRVVLYRTDLPKGSIFGGMGVLIDNL
jgi:hypothetical protein